MIDQLKLQTENWLNTVVIAYNICPFAHKVVAEKTIHYAVDAHKNIEDCLQQLILECERLDGDDKIETTLVIYQYGFSDFDDFLDYVEIANDLLSSQAYEGVYQLASFHPDYCFADSDDSDAANYTNRSPFPMLHLIREASIEAALKSYSEPESIPQRNIELTRKLGLAKMQNLLSAAKMSA